MAKAKGTITPAKESKKVAKPTPVKRVAKKSKPVAKASKNVTKKVIQAAPVITEAMYEAWFFNMKPKYFIKMQEEWNERNLKIKLKPQENYDAWLNYFKSMPPNTIKVLASTGLDILPTEGYAALSRWHDIISHPARIDKIHQSGLTNIASGKGKKSIAQLALENDRYGVLCATRDKIAEKLDKGAGSRDTALLTREMTEIMTQIADYEKRQGPKKETALGRLMMDMPEPAAKRPSKNGGGASNNSFKSRLARVTIEDLEG